MSLIKTDFGTEAQLRGLPDDPALADVIRHPSEMPEEFEGSVMGSPYYHRERGEWLCTVRPHSKIFHGSLCPDVYWHEVPCESITVSDNRFHIVRVMEMHCTPVGCFAEDAEDAIMDVEANSDCGGPTEYVSTMETDSWIVWRGDRDVTDE